MDVCACVCVCITKIFVSIKGLGLVISTFFWLLYMLIWLYFFCFSLMIYLSAKRWRHEFLHHFSVGQLLGFFVCLQMLK